MKYLWRLIGSVLPSQGCWFCRHCLWPWWAVDSCTIWHRRGCGFFITCKACHAKATTAEKIGYLVATTIEDWHGDWKDFHEQVAAILDPEISVENQRMRAEDIERLPSLNDQWQLRPPT